MSWWITDFLSTVYFSFLEDAFRLGGLSSWRFLIHLALHRQIPKFMALFSDGFQKRFYNHISCVFATVRLDETAVDQTPRLLVRVPYCTYFASHLPALTTNPFVRIWHHFDIYTKMVPDAHGANLPLRLGPAFSQNEASDPYFSLGQAG